MYREGEQGSVLSGSNNGAPWRALQAVLSLI